MNNREYIANSLRRIYNSFSHTNDKQSYEKSMIKLKEMIFNLIQNKTNRNNFNQMAIDEKQLAIALNVIRTLESDSSSIRVLDLVQDFIFHPPYYDKQISNTELLIMYLLLQGLRLD